MAGQLTDHEREQLREYVERWKEVGPELEKIRRKDIENADTQRAVQILFSDEVDCPHVPRRTTSGLVEQQAWFSKLRK